MNRPFKFRIWNNRTSEWVYGHFSKIEEEFHELKDAMNQQDRVLALVELSDLIGAIDGFLKNEFKTIDFNDIIKFSKLTQNAFETGDRK